MPRNSEDYTRPLEGPADVWDFIQEDLKSAKELLPVKGYWDATNAGRVRNFLPPHWPVNAICIVVVLKLSMEPIKQHFYDEAGSRVRRNNRWKVWKL